MKESIDLSLILNCADSVILVVKLVNFSGSLFSYPWKDIIANPCSSLQG